MNEHCSHKVVPLEILLKFKLKAGAVEGMPPILFSCLVPQHFSVICGVQGWQEAKLWEETHSFCLSSCHISPCLLFVFSCSLTPLVKAMEMGSQTFQAPWRRNCLPDAHTGVCEDAQVLTRVWRYKCTATNILIHVLLRLSDQSLLLDLKSVPCNSRSEGRNLSSLLLH